MAREATEWANERLRRSKQKQGAFDFLGDAEAAGEPFDMAPVDAEALKGAIVAWVSKGFAITFGLTGDGGAVGVHLLAGGDKRSKYCSNVADLEDHLATIAAARR